MTDAEFDALLRAALLEAVGQDWAHVLAREPAALPAPAFSPRYLRGRSRLLADPFGYGRKKTRPLWKRAAQWAACLLLCAGIAFGGAMLFSPTARAWVAQVIESWRDTHTSYTFTGEYVEGTDIGVWRPGYVPEGFEGTYQADDFDFGHVRYENPNEPDTNILFFYMSMTQGGGFSNDNEHSDYYQTTVGGCPADLYVSNTEGKSSFLIWFNEDLGIAYKLSSKLDYQELIAMAESVEKIN